MKKYITMILLTLSTMTANGAQGPGMLLDTPLPPLPANQSVVIQELTLPPGSAAPPHRHDAYVYVYVVEGAMEMQVEGGALKRIEAGEIFVETPQDIHLVMANPSDTEPARFVAFIIKAEDVPVVLPAD